MVWPSGKIWTWGFLGIPGLEIITSASQCSIWMCVPHRACTSSLLSPAAAAAAAAKSLQPCPTLCDPMDCSLPGFFVHGILQARTLEWVAISFSNAWKWKVKVKSLSRVRLFATPWTAAYQAPPSMGFSRQQYFSPLVAPKCLLQTQERPSRNVNSMSSMGKQRHQEAKRFGPRSQAIFPGRSNDKEPPATQETWVWPLGLEDPLEKKMATHSSRVTVHGVAKSWTRLSD